MRWWWRERNLFFFCFLVGDIWWILLPACHEWKQNRGIGYLLVKVMVTYNEIKHQVTTRANCCRFLIINFTNQHPPSDRKLKILSGLWFRVFYELLWIGPKLICVVQLVALLRYKVLCSVVWYDFGRGSELDWSVLVTLPDHIITRYLPVLCTWL